MTIITLNIIATINSTAQPIMYETNFENSHGFINYAPVTNNSWQVGSTTKPFFGAANTLPNAIMTDTFFPYPINCSSSFVIRFYDPNKPGTAVDNWIEFDHKYRTTPGLDGGSVEVSYDSIYWQNILLDSIFINNSQCMVGPPQVNNFYSEMDTLFNGQPGFSGTSNGWVHSTIWWCWYITMGPESIQIPPDSMWVRFTFYSDAFPDSLDGWIIDNLTLRYDDPSAVDEVSRSKNVFQIFPVPAKDEISLRLINGVHAERFLIMNNQGREVLSGKFESDKPVSVSSIASGYYLVRVFTESGTVYTHPLVIY